MACIFNLPHVFTSVACTLSEQPQAGQNNKRVGAFEIGGVVGVAR